MQIDKRVARQIERCMYAHVHAWKHLFDCNAILKHIDAALLLSIEKLPQHVHVVCAERRETGGAGRAGKVEAGKGEAAWRA